MTKVTIHDDCRNAPKKEFLKDVNVAFATGDIDFLINSVTDQIIWNIIGDRKIEGIKMFSVELEKMKDYKVSELIIEKIITHGKVGAVNGVMKMKNGKEYGFSDFYDFKNAKGVKVSSITSYAIDLEKK